MRLETFNGTFVLDESNENFTKLEFEFTKMALLEIYLFDKNMKEESHNAEVLFSDSLLGIFNRMIQIRDYNFVLPNNVETIMFSIIYTTIKDLNTNYLEDHGMRYYKRNHYGQ